ncbi:hypothetical protein M5689_012950 [Euphorbia peplus]|nr:hypothetical protein M5689_012950 [Euphorbia peplus]
MFYVFPNAEKKAVKTGFEVEIPDEMELSRSRHKSLYMRHCVPRSRHFSTSIEASILFVKNCLPRSRHSPISIELMYASIEVSLDQPVPSSKVVFYHPNDTSYHPIASSFHQAM